MDTKNRLVNENHSEWFHGSPDKISFLNAGSSITRFSELAKAYSHKPKYLKINVSDDNETGLREVEIRHDGIQSGFLYRVCVENLDNDLALPQNNSGPLGEEMVTTRKLEVDYITKVKVKTTYRFEERLADHRT